MGKKTLYISKMSDITRRDNTIHIKGTERKLSVPITSIDHIIISDECTLTTKIINLIGYENITISFLNYYGNITGHFIPHTPVSGKVRIQQSQAYLNPNVRNSIMLTIMQETTNKMLDNLIYYRNTGKKISNDINSIRELQNKMNNNATNENTIMGYEGNIKQYYYNAWKEIDKELDFLPRIKRPPNNKINCLISFINSLVYSKVRTAIANTSLDDSISFIHASSPKRHSLTLDLSEPFKPLITDKLIFTIVRKNMWKDNWFVHDNHVCLLSEHGRENVIKIFGTFFADKNYYKKIQASIFRFQKYLIGMEKNFLYDGII